MEKIPEHICSIIAEAVTGRLPRDDDRKLRVWLKECPERKGRMVRYLRIWRLAGLAGARDRFDANRAWKCVRNRIDSEAVLEKPGKERKRQSWYAVSLAASLLLGTTVGALWLGRPETAPVTRYLEQTVPRGALSELALPDGTKVTLNAGSRLRWSTGFGTADRELEFRGEGYFRVARNETLPCVVHLDEGVEIRVLGTEFNLRSYPDENGVSVVLKNGSVRASLPRHDRDIFVRPGERLTYDRKTGSLSLLPTDTERAGAWRENRLVFDDTELETILRTLERRFDLRIAVLRPEILQERYHGEFGDDETPEAIFRIISADKRFPYRISVRTVGGY